MSFYYVTKNNQTHTHVSDVTNCSRFEYRIKETEYEPNSTKNNKTFFLNVQFVLVYKYDVYFNQYNILRYNDNQIISFQIKIY